MLTIKNSALKYLISLSLFMLIVLFAATAVFAREKEDALSLEKLTSRIKTTWNTFKYLGIAGLKCNDCAFTVEPNDEERFWNFNSEPKILRIDPDGPAAGKLKKGDEIVAVDGILITTRRAGIRLAAIDVGQAVEITVRRGRSTTTETIITEEPDPKSELVIEGLDDSFAGGFGRLSKEVESLARYAAELSRSIGTTEMPAPPKLPGLVELPALKALAAVTENLRGAFHPDGWFGFRLSFNGTIKKTDEGPTQWSFNESPKVESIEPDSPADRAGLKEGDVLTHVDGVKLTSKQGGEKFSKVVPGQTVTWTIKRGREKLDMELDAIERPEKTPAPLSNLRLEYDDADSHTVRYKGSLGDTDIKVTGDESVKVTVDKKSGFIIIKSRGATVRLQLSDNED